MEVVHDKVKYPIGKFNKPPLITKNQIRIWINDLYTLASQLRKTAEHLSQSQLDSSYREGGWTVRQLIHHIFDSHVNAYIRVKLALTEDKPTIKPYDQDKWALLEDNNTVPVDVSIDLIDGLHKRWTAVLRSMKDDDFKREFFHPEDDRFVSLDEIVGMYAWHGNHHLAQILSVKNNIKN